VTERRRVAPVAAGAALELGEHHSLDPRTSIFPSTPQLGIHVSYVRFSPRQDGRRVDDLPREETVSEAWEPEGSMVAKCG
jgi:hypothetical protein